MTLPRAYGYQQGDSPSFTDADVTADLSVGATAIIGSTSVVPDGTFHVYTGSAGSVTANTSADDVVVETSISGGLSILTPNNQFASIHLGSPGSNQGAVFAWGYNALKADLGTRVVSSSLAFYADNNVLNLTLAGASGSERATFTRYISKSVTNSITAGSTQTQAGATALTTDINRITVVGTEGDGVKLPTAAAGAEVLVINDDSTEGAQVWPNTSDAIDGGAADAVDANTLTAGTSRRYIAVDGTNWYTA